MFVVVGYVVTNYASTEIAAALSVSLPGYFTTIGGIVWIVVFFALLIYVITTVMPAGSDTTDVNNPSHVTVAKTEDE
jgi:hypothetical protein